ncbi:hypothetical protein YT1_0201 [Rhodococcus ruber]|uniref:Uncharacterized protein n=1 Tax=Rhodococcoides kyotonense TaxID=398843 RepID=A0A177YBX8_9NOCA|nr:hypothetical protein YT1_0201 [Rhodococcus ruber]OAK53024.1 hypothetical protein A3K89_24480 [Rhodococcus kyotonensis]
MWSCLDDLGYVIPALNVVVLTCVVALMITTAAEFHHDTSSERTRAAELVMTVVGALLVAQGGFSIPVTFAEYSRSRGGQASRSPQRGLRSSSLLAGTPLPALPDSECVAGVRR